MAAILPDQKSKKQAQPRRNAAPAHTITAKRSPRRLTAAGYLLAALIAAALIWWQWPSITELTAVLHDQDAVSAALRSYGAWGPLALAVIQLIQVLVAVVPGHVFLIAAGYVYGLPLGFALNLTFVVAASQIGYLLARRWGRPLVHRLAAPEQVAKWESIAEKEGLLFFTIAFVLPAFPTDVMNFVAGLSGISSRKFFIANVCGRLPGVVLLTLIGSHGLELPASAWWVLGGVAALLYIMGRWLMGRIEQRHQQKQQENSTQSAKPPAVGSSRAATWSSDQP